MDLQQFITETLVQIAKGIEGAAEQLKDSTALINPPGIITQSSVEAKIYGYLDEKSPDRYRKAVETIEFDVAVHAVSGKETSGGIGISVGSIELGSRGKSGSENSSESRIRFRVPMVLPRPKPKEGK